MMFLLIRSPVYPLTHPLNAMFLSILTYTHILGNYGRVYLYMVNSNGHACCFDFLDWRQVLVAIM